MILCCVIIWSFNSLMTKLKQKYSFQKIWATFVLFEYSRYIFVFLFWDNLHSVLWECYYVDIAFKNRLYQWLLTVFWTVLNSIFIKQFDRESSQFMSTTYMAWSVFIKHDYDSLIVLSTSSCGWWNSCVNFIWTFQTAGQGKLEQLIRFQPTCIWKLIIVSYKLLSTQRLHSQLYR